MTQWGKEGVGRVERIAWKHIAICNTESGNLLCRHRELNSVLCDNLEGWDGMGDGREVQEGGGICIPAADIC